MNPIRKRDGILRFINIRSICIFIMRTLLTRFTSRAFSTKHSEISPVATPIHAYFAGWLA